MFHQRVGQQLLGCLERLSNLDQPESDIDELKKEVASLKLYKFQIEDLQQSMPSIELAEWWTELQADLVTTFTAFYGDPFPQRAEHMSRISQFGHKHASKACEFRQQRMNGFNYVESKLRMILVFLIPSETEGDEELYEKSYDYLESLAKLLEEVSAKVCEHWYLPPLDVIHFA